MLHVVRLNMNRRCGAGNVNKVLSRFMTVASRQLWGVDGELEGDDMAGMEDEGSSDIDADQSFATWQGSMGQLRALGEDMDAARAVLREADHRLLQGVVNILGKFVSKGKGECLGQDDRVRTCSWFLMEVSSKVIFYLSMRQPWDFLSK
jgi:hypothetical protein